MTDNSQSIILTDDNFQREVLASSVPVLVDFWAPWCGPCRMASPIVEALAIDFEGIAKVGKLNIDDYGRLATQYNIQAVPTLVLFKNGQVVEQLVGVAPKELLADKLNGLLQEQDLTSASAA